MTLQASGTISASQIRDEFAGPTTFVISNHYRGGARVPELPENAGIPTSGPISFSDFYSGLGVVLMTYEIIGGGGEGAGGYLGGNGNSGGDSSFSGTNFTTVTATGGTGGVGVGAFDGRWTPGEAGGASYYGPGGAGGANSDSNNQTPGFPAPSTSYGAGGGGGGAYPFSAQNGGDGGNPSTRVTGQLYVIPGSTITVTIGLGGSGLPGGGDGASGYAAFTVRGQTFSFTSSGSFIVP